MSDNPAGRNGPGEGLWPPFFRCSRRGIVEKTQRAVYTPPTGCPAAEQGNVFMPRDNLDWSALIPEIERIAVSVGRRKNASPRVKDKLIGLATSHVWQKSDLFDPARGSFGAWCQTVLANKCIDLIRKEAGEIDVIEAVTAQVEARVRESFRPDEDDEPLPTIDWSDVFDKAKPKPIDRILFVLDLEICDRFPSGTVARWLLEAGLPTAFPIQEIRGKPTHLRNKAIAVALLAAEGVEPGEREVKRKQDWIRTRLFRVNTRIAPYLQGGQ